MKSFKHPRTLNLPTLCSTGKITAVGFCGKHVCRPHQKLAGSLVCASSSASNSMPLLSAIALAYVPSAWRPSTTHSSWATPQHPQPRHPPWLPRKPPAYLSMPSPLKTYVGSTCIRPDYLLLLFQRWQVVFMRAWDCPAVGCKSNAGLQCSHTAIYAAVGIQTDHAVVALQVQRLSCEKQARLCKMRVM